jgi:hypothetical protein
MIDNAPTRLKARAGLSPTTCVTVAMRIESNTSVTCSDAPAFVAGRAPIDPRHEQAEHQRAKQAQQHAHRADRRCDGGLQEVKHGWFQA